jgi:hypothetical protein
MLLVKLPLIFKLILPLAFFLHSCGHHGSPGPGGGREPPGTQGARGWPGVGLGSGLTSPGPGPGSTLTAPGGAALTSFFRRLWCLSALRLTSIARALRRLSSRHRESLLPSILRLFFR